MFMIRSHSFMFFALPPSILAEPPLSLASGLKSKSPKKLLIALVNGGALLDFRARKDGATAVHRAVAANNAEALR